ncbi:unnamed protein product, partial [Ceratitis capitata]
MSNHTALATLTNSHHLSNTKLTNAMARDTAASVVVLRKSRGVKPSAVISVAESSLCCNIKFSRKCLEEEASIDTHRQICYIDSGDENN